MTLLRQQTERLGRLYDDPASRSHIRPFILEFDLQDTLHELVKPDPTDYQTFNEFFSREIKPEARPIADPEDVQTVSSVADCRLVVFQTISEATRIWIKGFGFTLYSLLLSPNLAVIMKGGSIAIHRLAPQDYHRWHSPIDGTIETITDIPGTYHTVNPQAINQASTLDVFCENRRSVMTVRRDPTGEYVVIVAIGAMLVGSIQYCAGIQPGADIHRGQCLGMFRYGGSTVVALFPAGEITFDDDLVKNSREEKCETKVNVGWRIGRGGDTWSPAVPRLTSETTVHDSNVSEAFTPLSAADEIYEDAEEE
ncbi:Phosphatidylserine decarboxylase proenzyme 3 [Elsinoe australis]|uniref:Phosphatidylserine decarboxylase proenzyme 3 n=1 Tax=Elsinoe australis TaxID=40998 RepID=A0A2P7ZTQ9_9PEZI|nr:Phosphatidylserine decarboxylase proenzyme 3 [Elsinoe australis]